MKRRVGLALVPAAVVFLIVLGALFYVGVDAGMEITRWSPPSWLGIGWPVGFPLLAALIASPVFLVAVVAMWVTRRTRP